MTSSGKTDTKLLVLTSLLTAGVFLLDLKLPLGVAGGVPFVIVVLLTWLSPNLAFTVTTAFVCSILIAIGLFASPAGSAPLWVVLINRFFALLALWSTAILILERKRADQANQKRRELEQKYLDIAGVMFLVLNTVGEVTLINRKGYSILGYSEGELQHKNWFETCIPPPIRNNMKKVFAQVMTRRGDLVEYYDNPVLTKSGEEKILSWHNTVLRDHVGNVIGTLSSGLDITDRTKATESLRASEERFRSLIRSMDDFIFTIDKEQHFTGVFGSWALRNGFMPDDFLGKTAQEIMSPETAALHEKANKKALRGEHVRFEWSAETGIGEERFFQTSLSPLRNSDNVVTGAVGVGRDITESKRALRAIEENEARMRAILETAVDAIITADEKGLIESFNPAAEKIFGYRAEEIIGKKIGLLMPSPYQEEHSAYIDSYLKTGKKQIIGIGREIVGRRKNGEVFPIRLAVSEVVLGERRFFTGLIRDITEQTELQQKILQSERLAVIGKMSAKVAHEIRNPLSSISLNAEMLEDEIKKYDAQGTDEAHVLLKSIIQEIDRVTALTDEYLQFSRMPESRPVRGDLEELVQEISEFVAEELKHKKIAFEFVPAASPVEVRYDRTQFRRVLLNLVRNAIEAMPKGGKLKIGLEKTNSHGILHIQDTGVGIPEDMLNDIFNPFFTTKMFGTGLGLAITQQVVNEHGGRIFCASSSDAGATFTIELPLDTKE